MRDSDGTTRRTLQPGMLLANTYRIVGKIKSGGMGAVYLCTNDAEGDSHPLAVKMILEEYTENAEAVRAFRDEAKNLRKVRHPAVVEYRTLVRDNDDNLLLVMDYVDGRSLKDYLSQGQHLTAKSAMDLATRLVGGLRTAHEIGVVHRDLSTDNIILPGGSVHDAKLIDFGIAKDLHSDRTVGGHDGLKGKIGFASPEQLGLFRGKIDERTDVYSLGLVIAEAAGIKLDVATNDLPTALQVRQKDPVLPKDMNPELRERLGRLLRADPEQRDRDIVKAWHGAVKEKPPAQKAPPRNRKGAKAWTFAAVAAITIAAVAYFWHPHFSDVLNGLRDDNRLAELRQARALMDSAEPGDRFKGMRTAVVLANAGSCDATLEIARRYNEGKPPLKADRDKARTWYAKPACEGDSEARRALRLLEE